MELVAMDMKQRGLYIARQLSFYGVSFRIEDVALSRDFTHMYNASVRLVRRSQSFIIVLYFISVTFICILSSTNKQDPSTDGRDTQ